MPYTLWSHGRLLGESELNYKRVFRRHRMGDFYPTTAVGLKLMAVATGVSPAGIDLAKMIRGSRKGFEKGKPSAGWLEETLQQTPEWADFAAAQGHCDALALELRGPDGSVIPTEWIDVRDTEFLLSLAREDEFDIGDCDAGFPRHTDDGRIDALEEVLGLADGDDEGWALELEDDSEWHAEEPFPRYQLQVMLRDDAAVP
jgi:hypothetical protein